MITLDKFLILKSTTLFGKVGDELLFRIAETAAREKPVAAQERILKRGDVGTSLFVIVYGTFRVHVGKVSLATLGEQEIFGELSALCQEPRIASVTAMTDGLLLETDCMTLFDMMHFDAGLAHGIIYALCERARVMGLQVQNLLRLTPNTHPEHKHVPGI